MATRQRLDFEEVRRFCSGRSVELTLARGSTDRGITIRAEFEGNGDFFTIEADDVEYVELPGTCWVGGLYFGRWQDLAVSKPKWTARRGDFSGMALAFWDHDASTIGEAPEGQCYAIVAGTVTFKAGCDWPSRP